MSVWNVWCKYTHKAGRTNHPSNRTATVSKPQSPTPSSTHRGASSRRRRGGAWARSSGSCPSSRASPAPGARARRPAPSPRRRCRVDQGFGGWMGGKGVVRKGSIFGGRIQLTYSSVLGAAPLPLLLAGLATGWLGCCSRVPDGGCQTKSIQSNASTLVPSKTEPRRPHPLIYLSRRLARHLKPPAPLRDGVRRRAAPPRQEGGGGGGVGGDCGCRVGRGRQQQRRGADGGQELHVLGCVGVLGVLGRCRYSPLLSCVPTTERRKQYQ